MGAVDLHHQPFRPCVDHTFEPFVAGYIWDSDPWNTPLVDKRGSRHSSSYRHWLGISEGEDSPSKRIINLILIARTPQLIFSFLYLNLYGLFTTMWLAEEWSDFASQRKALRTSKPRGQQFSAHFLLLPHKISLPLMVLFGVLRWLISRSVFLAVVAEHAPHGKLESLVSRASCGYSSIAMTIIIVLGVLLVLITIAFGKQKYDGSIPLVGSCSLAISAACHKISMGHRRRSETSAVGCDTLDH